MKYYLKNNVLDQALKRINWLYDEFGSVDVYISGGKDSTVVLELAIMVARERNKLPVTARFFDQEAEYRHTVEYLRRLKERPEINLRWYQIPIILYNATSKYETWLHCWNPGEKWMREHEPDAITENIYNTVRFKELFDKVPCVELPGIKSCHIGGVRAEESPARIKALTQHATYKGETWGNINKYCPDKYVFYPIYDWSYTDVWKFIHENKLDYNKIYDLQYMAGVPLNDMRVSNLHHETAVTHLFTLQEFEPDTYEKLTQRISGIDTAAKMGYKDFTVKKLPYMFKDWKEYRDYLLEKLVIDPKVREKMRRKFESMENKYGDWEPLYRLHVSIIITNDYEFTKVDSFRNNPKSWMRIKERKGLKVW